MDDEELEIPKGSLLKLLSTEDLTIHSVEALTERVIHLKNEINRTEQEIKNKKSAHDVANSIFS